MAHGAHGEVVEQADHAGLFEEGAEQDEEEDVGGRHVGGRAVDALGAEAQGADDLVQPVAAVGQRPRQVLAEQGVGQEHRADQWQAPAHHAARRFEHQRDGDDADHPVRRDQLTRARGEVGLEDPVVEGEHEAREAQHPAQRTSRGAERTLALTEGRVQREDHQQHEAHMDGTDHLAGQRVEGGHPDLVRREGNGHPEDGAAQGRVGGGVVRRGRIGHEFLDSVAGQESRTAPCGAVSSTKGAYLMRPASL